MWDMDLGGTKEPRNYGGAPGHSRGRGNLRTCLVAHCKVQEISGASQAYSVSGSSDAAFHSTAAACLYVYFW